MDKSNEREASEKNIPSLNTDTGRKRKREDSADSEPQCSSTKSSPTKSESSSKGETSPDITSTVSSSESESNSNEQTRSDRPVNEPGSTSECRELLCFSKHGVSVDPDVYSPKEIFNDFCLYPLTKFNFSRSIRRRSETLQHQAKLVLFRQAMLDFMDINFQEVTQIPLEKLQELYFKVEESVNSTWKALYCLVSSQSVTDRKLPGSIQDLPLRLEIMKHVQHFICQLIYMVRNMEDETFRTTEAMYLELFSRFLQIFQLEAFCGKNIRDYNLEVGENTVICRPDGLVCLRLRDTKSVIAVVKVKSENSNSEDEASERTLRSREKKYTQKHVEEMLAILPQSMFDEKGVLGFTVQGTEVTVSSMSADSQHLWHLKKGTIPKKDYDGVSVKYSTKHNILTRAGREELMETLLLTASLYDFCDG